MTIRTTRALSTAQTPDWRTQAACRVQDPELWFPKGSTGPGSIQAAEAKATCRTSCPVAMTCALWSVKVRLQHGIAGGLDATQRQSLARKGTRRELNRTEMAAEVRAEWARDARNPLVDAYLRNSVQGDDGHVWWRGRKTSYSVAGRVLTPGQIAYEIGRDRAPSGHVKATCGQPFCVAAEHLADGLDRWQRDHATAA